MFSKATVNFVRQIDPDGSLIPVSRLNDSVKLVPMALVIKRNRFWFWQKPKYRPSDFTLSHLLLGDVSLSPAVSESEFLTYEGKFGDATSGKLDAKAGGLSVNVEGRGTSKLQSSFGRLRKQEVDVRSLLQNCNDRSVDMHHVLVQQAEKRAEVFAVLKERILTTTPCVITETHQGQGTCAGVLGALGNMPVEVCVKENGSVQVDSDVSLEIPPHTVIAYSLIELEIKKDGFYELCLQPGTLGGFETDSARSSPSRDSYDSPCEVDGRRWSGDRLRDGAPLSALQIDLQESEVHLRSFVALPKETRSVLFQMFQEVVLDRTVLTAVEHLLEEWCRGETPVKTEVKELPVSQNKSVCVLLDLVQPDAAYQIENEGPSPPPLLTSAHMLVSALEALPDDALSLLGKCSPEVLEALNTLMTRLRRSGQPLPLESVPLALRDDGVLRWAERLLGSSNVTLRKERSELWAEIQSQPGVFPLVLCIAVQGLTSLCAGQM